MKTRDKLKESLTQPLLKKLLERHKVESKEALKGVTIGSDPLTPSDLYQDAGGGYNANGTFPQQ